MPQCRQLAAIMFTDIVGYTALMGNDEDKAFELLNTNRQIQKTFIQQYNGRWIKELGDGVLATFSTVTDAVSCACSIIKGCEGIEGLQLRIGIHQSEVVFENNEDMALDLLIKLPLQKPKLWENTVLMVKEWAMK